MASHMMPHATARHLGSLHCCPQLLTMTYERLTAAWCACPVHKLDAKPRASSTEAWWSGWPLKTMMLPARHTPMAARRIRCSPGIVARRCSAARRFAARH
ncbi:hypothetical protein Dimus_017559, partial [Dionaea muscipula]